MENEARRDVPIQKVIYDILLLMCVGFPILFLFIWGQPYHRGFFCDDESIRHPYHQSTVPNYFLIIFGLGLTTIVMIVTEFFSNTNDERKFVILGFKLPMWICNVYCVLGIFYFGAACSQLTTDIMKYTIGRLRPHFYTVCLPSINCTDPKNMYVYHEDFHCTNPKYMNAAKVMKESRLSFPSGHSSFSMYCMLYFSIYLQSRMTWNGSKLLRHTLQFLAITSSVYTGMTRVSDYKHHWSDVLSGFLLGALIASLVAAYVSTLFPSKCGNKAAQGNTELNNFSVNGQQIQSQPV